MCGVMSMMLNEFVMISVRVDVCDAEGIVEEDKFMFGVMSVMSNYMW